MQNREDQLYILLLRLLSTGLRLNIYIYMYYIQHYNQADINPHCRAEGVPHCAIKTDKFRVSYTMTVCKKAERVVS